MQKFILSLISGLALSINGQTFMNADLTFTSGIGANAPINHVIEQPDGKLIVVGEYTSYNNLPLREIVRLNSNGTLDLSFNCGIGLQSSGPYSKIYTACLQSDGKILLGGKFNNFNGTVCKNIIRLNSNGSVDNSFNALFNNDVTSIVVQSNNKIIVLGRFSNLNYTDSCGSIVRLNSNGSIDNSFLTGSGISTNSASSPLVSAKIMDADTLIVYGYFNSYNSYSVKHIMKLYPNGLLDTNFVKLGGFNHYVRNLDFDANKNIYCYGDYNSYKGKPIQPFPKIKRNGILDTTYMMDNYIYGGTVHSMMINANGENLFHASIYPNFYISKLLKRDVNGQIDTINCKSGNGFNSGAVNVLKRLNDGKIIAAGNFLSYRGYPFKNIARIIESNPNSIFEMNERSSYLKLFPNPANNEINITTDLDGASIQLYSIVGQLVLESKLNSETKLSLINLSSGSYIYKIVKDNNLIKTEKILINK
jgi:uncharacterized delta-60 repeat protein